VGPATCGSEEEDVHVTKITYFDGVSSVEAPGIEDRDVHVRKMDYFDGGKHRHVVRVHLLL